MKARQPIASTLQNSGVVTPLHALIRDAIQRRGPVCFRWFMKQALYHPVHGYYSSGQCAVGRHGDYFTNVSVGPLFGSLLAAQFAEMWELLDRPANFKIVEQGAHHGDFGRDVLEAARRRTPEFFAALRYEIIEPFGILEVRQAAALTAFREKITWTKSLDELAPFCGVHFSNELLDAMPVHLISSESDNGVMSSVRHRWSEKYVTTTSDGFELVNGPISTTQLQDYLFKLPAPPASPYNTEANLAAIDWIETVSRKIERGYVLAVDYGYRRAEFYAPERINGTLRCYAKHRVAASPLIGVGHTDITAHVDWTSLVERAEQCGLDVAGFTDQHHFITGVATKLVSAEFTGADSTPQRRALQMLLHPGLLGMTFQFLGLSKKIPRETPLSGFIFSRNAHRALGLK